jgi:hypothetical protein
VRNITFITTGQPTTNPRLVKEAETLINLGYNVKVIYCFYNKWAQHFDKDIIARNPKMYILCGGDLVEHKVTYYKTRIRQKVAFLLFKLGYRINIAEQAISRTHTEALSVATKIKTDLYIAHNLGALPAAVIAAKLTHAKVGYDAEDLHSAQYTSAKDHSYLLNKYIEEKFFSQVNYFTAASPLIASFYKKTYLYLNPIVINNTFPKAAIPSFNKCADDILKLFWFSQTIGTDRGVTEIIAAMTGISNVELHLLGYCSEDTKMQLNNLMHDHKLKANQLRIHPPVSPDQLLNFAAQFDIGMAAETGVPLNRDICLTNKIFTYIQCGLAVIASDTQAQTQFLHQYPQAGKIYERGNVMSLAGCINTFADDRKALYQTQLTNYQLGQTHLNWETESLTFVKTIDSIFTN